MSTQITLTLPDETYRQIERRASNTRRSVAEVMLDTLESAAPLDQADELQRIIPGWSDEQVMLVAESMMDEDQNSRYIELFEKQQSGLELSDSESREMWGLMEVYKEGLLNKAFALAEAVRRGLRGPLES